MFKKAGGVKKNNVAVFGGGELDENSLKHAREAHDRDHHEQSVRRDRGGGDIPEFGRREDTEYAGERSETASTIEVGGSSAHRIMGSLLSFDALSIEEKRAIPEKLLRGIMLIVAGLGLSEVHEVDSLLGEVRKALDRDFKRQVALDAGGTINYARLRNTQRLERTQTMRMRKSGSMEESQSPLNPGSPTGGAMNCNGTYGGVALASEEEAMRNAEIDLMATFGRSVNFKLLGDEDARFRSPEQKTEDYYVDLFTRWQPFAHLVIFFVQMYIVLAVLIRIGFEIPIPLHIFVLDKFLVDLPMIIKITVSFVALYDDGSGVPKFRPRERARDYLRSGAFFIDLVGAIPLDLVGHLSGSRTTLLTGRYGFVAPQWNLNRLLQCRGMFDSFENVVEELMLRADVHPSAARLFHSSLVFLVSVHVVSCMVFFLLYLYPTSFVEWFQSDTLATADLFDQYIAAFDWSSKNMVGMSRGSAFPSEEVQMIAVVFVTSFGVCMYGLLMANLSAYVERSTPESELQQTIDEVLDTAEYVGMPAEYTQDIIRYYEHASVARHHTQDVLEVVEDLPRDLGEEIIFTVGRDICRAVPLLVDEAENQRFVLQLMDAMVPVMLLPKSTLFRRDDVGDSMYIVVSGELTVLSPADDATPIAHLGPGSVVGEIALVADVPRTATVVTAEGSFTDCLAIDSEAFGSLLEQFPKALENIEAKVAERIEELAARQEELNRQKRRESVMVMVAAAKGDDDGQSAEDLLVLSPATAGRGSGGGANGSSYRDDADDAGSTPADPELMVISVQSPQGSGQPPASVRGSGGIPAASASGSESPTASDAPDPRRRRGNNPKSKKKTDADALEWSLAELSDGDDERDSR